MRWRAENEPLAASRSSNARSRKRLTSNRLTNELLPHARQPDQLDVKDQRRVRRDLRRAAGRAVPEVAGDRQLALLADLHPHDAFVPPLDDLALAELELDRLLAIERGVEGGAVGELARVVD